MNKVTKIEEKYDDPAYVGEWIDDINTLIAEYNRVENILLGVLTDVLLTIQPHRAIDYIYSLTVRLEELRDSMFEEEKP